MQHFVCLTCVTRMKVRSHGTVATAISLIATAHCKQKENCSGKLQHVNEPSIIKPTVRVYLHLRLVQQMRLRARFRIFSSLWC